MKVNFANKTVGGFEYEFIRGISTQQAGTAEFGECMETMERIHNGNFESWVREWSATADRVAAYAQDADHAGDQIAARDAYLKASNYYRMAVFYAHYTDPRHTTLWQQSRDCFHHMIRLMDQPIESFDIAFEGAKLPAYFLTGGEGKRPTLIALGGFDSTMEEIYGWIGPVAAQYGWHCLIFEGPGQWAALKTNPGLLFRPDYEKPVSAVVDYLFSRPDVDQDKVALIGYSAGVFRSQSCSRRAAHQSLHRQHAGSGLRRSGQGWSEGSAQCPGDRPLVRCPDEAESSGSLGVSACPMDIGYSKAA